MLLADLGLKINNALQRLNCEKDIDEEVVSAVITDIQLALLQSDVNENYLKKLSEIIFGEFKKVQHHYNYHISKIIQQAVVKELT